MSYTADFMRALYPEGEADQRLQLWFNPATVYNANRTFQMKKFLVTADPNSIDFNDRNDATQCIYRYADIFLMQAEAYAELGNEGAARATVGAIRERAKAAPLLKQETN
ncbi:RagB/SusD family nutrient uptake outer membrane protein [Niabella sp. W65]|nr:RagB/SusD family nutrient uptake outer membrane protein [Niabella sp. W65]MCH7366751.1 RagB/SusD family nutrient uptake outer membrane protein [Niabella sp. W65]